MAEKDPFEAAMEALDGGGNEGSADDASNLANESMNDSADDALDPFDLAQEAIGGEDSGGSAITDPFEAAMNAMETGDEVNTAEVDTDSNDDPFAAALEIAKAEHKVAEAKKSSSGGGKELDLDFLMEIKLNLTFEVGRTQMYISDLLSLGQGSVIELHRLVGEELELFVNGQLLATGEVVVVNEKFGARISKILSPEERINHLGPAAVII